MKKVLFLLVTLLGSVGITNATAAPVDFKLTTPTDLATNTLSIDKSSDATTQLFTVAYENEEIEFDYSKLADVVIVDASYQEIKGVTNVLTVGQKFCVVLDASTTDIKAGDPILIAFPEGCFKAKTSGNVNKKFGVHLDVCKAATFTLTGDTPANGKWETNANMWTIPAEYVTPASLTGKIASNPAGYGKAPSASIPANVTWNSDGTFTISGTKDESGNTIYNRSYTFPKGTFRVQNANKSWSYSPEFTITVVQYSQYVNMTVKDAYLNTSVVPVPSYNPNKEVSTKTDDIRLQFSASSGNLNNIDRADLTQFTITGTAIDGTVVNETINGSDFAYTSTNEDKTFTTALPAKLHAGTYLACMEFNTENMEIAGVDKIQYEKVFCKLDVYQVADESTANITNDKALDGEDIYITVDNLEMNMTDHTSSTIALLNQFNGLSFAGNFQTAEAPYVTNAAGDKTEVVKIARNENTKTYTITLEKKLDAGKGYILTFPKNSVYVLDGEKLFYNNKLEAVNLDIWHGFEFKDIANDQTTKVSEIPSSDTYDRLHFTRLSTNGNFAAQVLPFDVNVADVPAMEFYQITAASYENDAPVLYINKVKKTAYAWQPYLVKVNSDIDNLILKGYTVQQTALNSYAGEVTTSSAFDEYRFISTADGDLTGKLPSVATTDYLLVGNQGGLYVLDGDQRKAYNQEYTGADATKNKTIHQWRFYVICNHKYGFDNGVDYSKISFVEGDETTGINAVSTQTANGAMYNVAGQRVSAPVKGQVYIMNGKKYVK